MTEEELKEKAYNDKMKRIDKRLRLIYIAFIAVAFIGVFIQFYCGSNQHRPQVNADSLRMALEITKRQQGKEIAILLNENTQLAKDKQKLSNEKEAIKQRENNLAKANKELIKKLREIAPIECDTFIGEIVNSYEKLIAKKDSSYNAQAEELCKEEERSANLQKIIARKDTIAKADSLIIAESDAAKKKAEKQAKRSKFITKVVGIAAAVGILTSFYVSLIK